MSVEEIPQDREDRERVRLAKAWGQRYAISTGDMDADFARAVLGQPPVITGRDPKGQETPTPTQTQDKYRHVWEDEKADPTDRAVSFARSEYDNKDSKITRAVSSAQLRNIGTGILPDEYDPSYGDKLVEILSESITYWVNELTTRYPGSDPVRVHQEIEAIIRKF